MENNIHWKYGLGWFAMAGIISLGLLKLTIGGDFDCDDDCGCDSDGDGYCDYDTDGDGDCDCDCHNDTDDYYYDTSYDDYSNRRRREEASDDEETLDSITDLFAWMRSDFRKQTQQDTRPKGIQKKSENELKGVRRSAFIWNRKRIAVGYDSEDLLEEDYEKVYVLLHNQAFKDVVCVPQKVLGPRSWKTVGSVKTVKIGKDTRFSASDKFPYDSKVIIYYRDKKEIKVPFSGKAVQKKAYDDVYDELVTLGFTNVRLKPQRNILTKLLKIDGKVNQVYIDGIPSFDAKEAFPFDAEIVINYYTRLF